MCVGGINPKRSHTERSKISSFILQGPSGQIRTKVIPLDGQPWLVRFVMRYMFYAFYQSLKFFSIARKTEALNTEIYLITKGDGCYYHACRPLIHLNPPELQNFYLEICRGLFQRQRERPAPQFGNKGKRILDLPSSKAIGNWTDLRIQHLSISNSRSK